MKGESGNRGREPEYWMRKTVLEFSGRKEVFEISNMIQQ